LSWVSATRDPRAPNLYNNIRLLLGCVPLARTPSMISSNVLIGRIAQQAAVLLAPKEDRTMRGLCRR
jgi:hypothetical protein